MTNEYDGATIGRYQRYERVDVALYLAPGVLVAGERVADAVNEKHFRLVCFDQSLQLRECASRRVSRVRIPLP